MRTVTCAVLAALLLVVLAAGCSSKRPYRSSGHKEKLDTVALPYHEAALTNMVLGRTYMAEGRYELARERLLIALSAARDEELRIVLAEDLEAVDRMIRSRR